MSLESTQVDLNDTNRSHEPKSKRSRPNISSVTKHMVLDFDFCTEARPIDLIQVKSSIKQVFINTTPLADIPCQITNPDYAFFSPSKDCIIPDIQLSSPFGYPASRLEFEPTPKFDYTSKPRNYELDPLFKWAESHSFSASPQTTSSQREPEPEINFDFARLSKENLLVHDRNLDTSIVPDNIEDYFAQVPNAPDTIQTVKLRSRLKFNSIKPEKKSKKSTRVKGGTPAPYATEFNQSRYQQAPVYSLDVTPLDAPCTVRSERTDTKLLWSNAKAHKKAFNDIKDTFSPKKNRKKKTIGTIPEVPEHDQSLCSTLVDSPSGESSFVTDKEFDSCGFDLFDPYGEMFYENQFYDPKTGKMVHDVNTPSKPCNIKPFNELYPETPESTYFNDSPRSDLEASFDPSLRTPEINQTELSNVTIRRRPRKRKFSEVSDSGSSSSSEPQSKKHRKLGSRLQDAPLSDSFQTSPFEHNDEHVDDLGTLTPGSKSDPCKNIAPDAKTKWSEAKFKLRQVFANRIAKPDRKKSIDAGISNLFTTADIQIQNNISTQDQPLYVPFKPCVLKPRLNRIHCQIGTHDLPSGKSETIDAYFLSHQFD